MQCCNGSWRSDTRQMVAPQINHLLYLVAYQRRGKTTVARRAQNELNGERFQWFAATQTYTKFWSAASCPGEHGDEECAGPERFTERLLKRALAPTTLPAPSTENFVLPFFSY